MRNQAQALLAFIISAAVGNFFLEINYLNLSLLYEFSASITVHDSEFPWATTEIGGLKWSQLALRGEHALLVEGKIF